MKREVVEAGHCVAGHAVVEVVIGCLAIVI